MGLCMGALAGCAVNTGPEGDPVLVDSPPAGPVTDAQPASPGMEQAIEPPDEATSQPGSAPAPGDTEPAAQPPTAQPPGDSPGGFRLVSDVMAEGGEYPNKYSCNGDDVLPPLVWGEPPAGTQSFVLTFTDLDADLNEGRFVHWALYDIPGDTRGLPEDIGPEANPQALPMATQVRGWSAACGAWLGSQFLGPCPSETHTYEFKLYALGIPNLADASCNLQPIQIDDLVVQSGAVLAETTLSAFYTPQ